MGYDGLGRMSEVYAPRRADETATVVQRIGFDAAGRANTSAILRSDGSTAVASVSTFDKDSKVTGVTLSGEATSSVSYVYDKLDRAIKETQVTPAGSFETSTALDVANLATKTTLTGLGGGWDIDNVFAKTGQWNSTKATGGTQFDFTYNSAGSVVAAKSASSTLDCAYDANGRLVYQVTGIPGDDMDLAYIDGLQEYEMSYDARERIESVNRIGSVPGDANDEFRYDTADRLSLWTRNGAQTSYSYDKSGNLTSQVKGSSSTTFGYDADDRITTMTAGSAVTTFTHDAYGRMTGRSGATTETYGWDARSELATVASSEGTVTYQYDAAGLPARRQSSVSGDATDTVYFWSGGKLAASKSADGTLMRYVYGPGGMPLQLIVTKAGGSPTPYWYHLDPLGNVVALTDAEGWTTASYDYDPWGKAISTVYQSDPAISRANPLRYRGYFYDAELELYVLPARVYDPALKRFLSVDPVAEKIGVPQSANRYAYCQSNPITFIDPDGTDILLGNYYPPAQSRYEPDIPQQDWTGDGYGTKHSSGPGGTSSGHGESSSGQRERQAADARAAIARLKKVARDEAERRADAARGLMLDSQISCHRAVTIQQWERRSVAYASPNIDIGLGGGFVATGVVISGGRMHPYIGVGPKTLGASIMMSDGPVKHGWNSSLMWSVGFAVGYGGAARPLGHDGWSAGAATPGASAQYVLVF